MQGLLLVAHYLSLSYHGFGLGRVESSAQSHRPGSGSKCDLLSLLLLLNMNGDCLG